MKTDHADTVGFNVTKIKQRNIVLEHMIQIRMCSTFELHHQVLQKGALLKDIFE